MGQTNGREHYGEPWRLTHAPVGYGAGIVDCREYAVDRDGNETTGTLGYATALHDATVNGRPVDHDAMTFRRPTYRKGEAFPHTDRARRIVAAVNTCEGIPTDVLTRGAARELVERTRKLAAVCRLEDIEPHVRGHLAAVDAALAKLTPHVHHAGEGDDPDRCALCGRDIREPIHCIREWPVPVDVSEPETGGET